MQWESIQRRITLKASTEPSSETLAKYLSVRSRTNWLRILSTMSIYYLLFYLLSLSTMSIQCASTFFSREIIRMKSRRFLSSATINTSELSEDASYTENYILR